MALRSKKLRVVAAVAVCSLGVASASQTHPEEGHIVPEHRVPAGASELTHNGAGHLPTMAGGPREGPVRETLAKGAEKKGRPDLKIKLRRGKKEKKIRRRRVVDSSSSVEIESHAEVRRRRLQSALNAFSMFAQAILSFTECFGENGPFQQLKRSFGPRAPGVFRDEDGAAAEEMEEPAPVNCALGAVMKAVALFEGDEGSRPVTRELDAAMVAARNGATYFVVDSSVLLDQAYEFVSWLHTKVEALREELADLRLEADTSDDEDDPSTPLVAVRESPMGGLPSPWTIMTPEEPDSEFVGADMEE